ncbi:MAG: hypothetical protein NT154_09675, partial [Verrucomicrobia bacterium]|nr:hypothetical protein [Verrucomicrobiota bacterium]
GTLTGSQLYNKINCTLMAYGGARVDVPPVKPSFQALAVTALVAANAGGTISLKLTSPSDPGENTILIASPPVSQGIEVAPALYVIGSCPAPVLGASDITALYTAKFGAPAVGQKVYVGAFQHSDGYETLPTTYSAIIPAST